MEPLFYNQKNRNISGRGGYSLVELLVAVSVFASVMVLATGSLLSLIDGARKVRAQKTVMDNLNFAVENMSRNLRVGSNYDCGAIGAPTDCPQGSTSLSFLSTDGKLTVYTLTGSTIQRSVDGGQTFVAVTAPEISIDRLSFFVSGTGQADTLQPKILMLVGGVVTTNNRTKSRFDLETMISERQPDVSF